jgi:hypothetical protein
MRTAMAVPATPSTAARYMAPSYPSATLADAPHLPVARALLSHAAVGEDNAGELAAKLARVARRLRGT